MIYPTPYFHSIQTYNESHNNDKDLVSAIILILAAATFTPLAAFAYSDYKKDVNTVTPHDESITPVKSQTDLKVPANAGELYWY